MSLPDEIHKLHAMLKAGALTTGEFEQRKQILLSGEYAGLPAAVAPDQPGPRQPESVLASGEYLVQVGAYKVLEKVGEGGMGVVYRARHTQSAVAQRQGGDVALKVLHEQLAKRPDFRERFDREADLGLRLNHRNVVKVHDLVIDGSRLALVMEWVEGRPLSKMIGEETGPLPWERAWPVFEQILDGLEHIHEAGIVHRDLKPENIMVTTDGRVKVLDLGIAKGEGERITKHGVKLGTVDYMAPEVILGNSQNRQVDIWCLGVLLYVTIGFLPPG